MLTIRSIAAGCILGSLLALGSLSAPATEDELQNRLQTRLDEIRSSGGYPGITAAISTPDGRLLTAASGWADAEKKIQMKPTDRMLAGSVGKTFVSAVILQTIDEGLLDLDSKLERWIGREPWFDRVPNAHSLTLRLLLSHRSGIPDHVEQSAFLKAFTTDLSKDWTPQELIGWILDKRPLFPAGNKYFYADMNYIIAGLVFERVTGQKLFGEIERRIIRPFSLEQTVPSQSRSLEGLVPGELDPRELKIKGQSIQGGHLVYNAQAEYAGGGLISTSGDLARWAKLLWEGKVFSRAMLDEMLDAKPSEKGVRYGLGVQVLESQAGPAYSHDGWIPGYQTVVVYFPMYKVAAAAQMNADPLKHFKVPFDSCIGRIAGVVIKDLLPKTAQMNYRGRLEAPAGTVGQTR